MSDKLTRAVTYALLFVVAAFLFLRDALASKDAE